MTLEKGQPVWVVTGDLDITDLYTFDDDDKEDDYVCIKSNENQYTFHPRPMIFSSLKEAQQYVIHEKLK